MHRRARHLNPKHAGASIVLDSRRISGLVDGDPVSTWSDASGNSHDGTNTLTARPTYKTAIQGGQPVVRFDGSNDYLSVASPFTFAADAFSVLVYKRLTTGHIMVPICGANNQTSYPIFEYSNNTLYVASTTTNMLSGGIGVAWRVSETTAGPTTSLAVRMNGATVTPGGYSYPSSPNNMTVVGARLPAEFSNGDIALITVIRLSISSSLKRRLAQAAAFSFKIKYQ